VDDAVYAARRRGRRTVTDPILFIGSYIAIALLAIYAFPSDLADVPEPLRAFGEFLQTLIPSIRAVSALTSFTAEAWLTAVLLWALVPVYVAFGFRLPGLFVPDMPRLRTMPWVLPIAILALALIAFAMTRFEVSSDDLGGRAPHERALSFAAASRITFAIAGGVVCGGVALCLRVIAGIVSIAPSVLRKPGR
jgi:hypothetical protein